MEKMDPTFKNRIKLFFHCLFHLHQSYSVGVYNSIEGVGFTTGIGCSTCEERIKEGVDNNAG